MKIATNTVSKKLFFSGLKVCHTNWVGNIINVVLGPGMGSK